MRPSTSALLSVLLGYAPPVKKYNIIDYAETTVIPSGKLKGMRFSHETSPYLKEPLSLLSPESEYREVVFMSAAQQGKSTIAELVAMFYITQVPSEIMYVTSDEKAAMRWLSRRIVPRAAAAGVVFKEEVETRVSRRSGNTAFSKTFPGGLIDVASALSVPQLSQETRRLVLCDEVDRWKVTLGFQGGPVDMIKARTNAWGSQAKILYISTPTTEDASLIYQLYSQGDQRQYYCMCPKCGAMQTLVFYEGHGHGLHFVYKKDKIDRKSIVYICEKCQKAIKETQKHRMLINGEWRKTVEPLYDFTASFSTNGLYSPFLSWYQMAIAYIEGKNNPVKKQALDNFYMGQPYKEVGIRPKVEKLINNNRGSYKSGEVPEGVAYLVGGVDVQRGSEIDPDNPARLEVTIAGIGAQRKLWVIEHKIFYGSTALANSGAWLDFSKWMRETRFCYYRVKDRRPFSVAIVLLDSGDGERTDVVFQYCQQVTEFYPSKGFNWIMRQKHEGLDPLSASNFLRHRKKIQSDGHTLYEISTNHYKNVLFKSFNVERIVGPVQNWDFVEFPGDLPQKYFDQLCSEEKLQNGNYKATGRNEALDCLVLCRAAGDIVLDEDVKRYREQAQKLGWPQHKIDEKYNHLSVINRLSNLVSIKKQDKKTLRDIKRVSENVENVRRQTDLSFSHHAEIAAIHLLKVCPLALVTWTF